MGAPHTIRAGIVGFGWMGQAHARSLLRGPTIFQGAPYRVQLAAVADNVADRRTLAVEGFGAHRTYADWHELLGSGEVDAVWITAPNMLHVEIIEAAAAARLAVFCEKPVGGTPDQTVRAYLAAEAAGIATGVGYNYRWAPLVQHAKHLIDTGLIGEIVHYRGVFFSMYGSDPAGRLSWRYLVDQGGYGVSTDLLSHSVDLAAHLVGPVEAVVAATALFIPDRPVPTAGGTHYDRGAPGDPTGRVTNEDYIGVLARFSTGARATFEACRTFHGPESQNTFTVYGTRGAIRWNLETMNQLEVYVADDPAVRGWTTINGGDRFPYHGAFVPGDANGIGFEDVIAIEDHEFCLSLATGQPFNPGFAAAVRYVSVQDAILRSVDSGRWEDVVDIAALPSRTPDGVNR